MQHDELMAWIYLAESAESQRPWRAMSNLLPTVKMTDTLNVFCFQEWQRLSCRAHPSGTISGLCEPECYRDLPMSSMAVSLAKTFPLPDAERAWQESEAAFSSRSLGSLARFDPDSFSWKTFQLSIFGAETLSSELWPTSGMTVDGTCYQLRMWERITDENDGGYWPTPNVPNGGRSPKGVMSRTGVTPEGKKRQVGLHNAVKMWPTPTTRDDRGPASHMLDLGHAAKLWPTPKSSPSGPDFARMNREGSGGDDLATAAARFASPAARDWKSGKGRQENGHSPQLPEQVGGSLNPTWVEWLMGYPSGWTVCEPWAIAWFRPKREKRLRD